MAIENFNEHLKAVFDALRAGAHEGRGRHTARFALGAVFVYQLAALLYPHEHDLGANVGLSKPSSEPLEQL